MSFQSVKPGNIFDKYTEFGEKKVPKDQGTQMTPVKVNIVPPIFPTSHNKAQQAGEEDKIPTPDVKSPLDRYAPLPNISSNKENETATRKIVTVLPNPNETAENNEKKNVDREASLFALTRLKGASCPVEDYQSTVVSPVTTPLMIRPETRQLCELTMAEKVHLIVQGQMDIKMAPDKKSVRVFIHSAFTGKSYIVNMIDYELILLICLCSV